LLTIEETNDTISKLEEKIENINNININKEEVIALKIEELDTLHEYIESRKNDENFNSKNENFHEREAGEKIILDSLLLSEDNSVNFGLISENKNNEKISLYERNLDNKDLFQYFTRIEETDQIIEMKAKIEELTFLLTEKEELYKESLKRIEELSIESDESKNLNMKLMKNKNTIIALAERNKILTNDKENLTEKLSKNEEDFREIAEKYESLCQKIEEYYNENILLKKKLDEALGPQSKMNTELSPNPEISPPSRENPSLIPQPHVENKTKKRKLNGKIIKK